MIQLEHVNGHLQIGAIGLQLCWMKEEHNQYPKKLNRNNYLEMLQNNVPNLANLYLNSANSEVPGEYENSSNKLDLIYFQIDGELIDDRIASMIP